jgi:uncharacterized membrane protein YoaK (UPF0700 family)
MQRTRLNTLVEVRGQQLSEFFANPWRRISLLLLGFLSGFFIGAAVSTTAGQDAQWDVVCAALVLLATELTNRWVYRHRRPDQIIGTEVINTFKIGVVYSLFLEAFKLGS